MSYILDALRRADSERERGEVPSLHTQQYGALPGDDEAPARSRLLVGVIVVLVLALAAALAWNFWAGDSARHGTAQGPVSIAATTPAALPTPRPTPEIASSPSPAESLASPASPSPIAPSAPSPARPTTPPDIAPQQAAPTTRSDARRRAEAPIARATPAERRRSSSDQSASVSPATRAIVLVHRRR